MGRGFYSEINLHMVWRTKHSAALLTPEVEPVAHRILRQKALDLPGVFFREVGGTETHVHMVVSILPTVAISELIGRLKGYSAHETNGIVGRGDKVLAWQTGYGVVSFGTRDMGWVVRYVRRQKEHHAADQTYARLEQTDCTDDEPAPQGRPG